MPGVPKGDRRKHTACGGLLFGRHDLLQLPPQQHDPNAPEHSQPMRPMYAMERTGLEAMAQDPVEQPTRA